MVAALLLTAALAAGNARPARREAPKEQPKESADHARVKTFKFGGLDLQGGLDKPRGLHFMDPQAAEPGPTRAQKRSFVKKIDQSLDAEEL